MPREPDRLNERKAHSQHLQELGFSKLEIFEKMVSDGVMAKEAACANRCPTCWHDKGQRCICAHIPPHNLSLRLNVKVLVLMHHKEYLSAGDDAKLLLAALPESQSDLFVFGRSGDWLRSWPSIRYTRCCCGPAMGRLPWTLSLLACPLTRPGGRPHVRRVDAAEMAAEMAAAATVEMAAAAAAAAHPLQRRQPPRCCAC